MNEKLEEIIQQDIEIGKMKIMVKDRCFVCGCDLDDGIDPLVRYYKHGNTCDECFTCSGFSKSTVPLKAKRYKKWCLRLELLKNVRDNKLMNGNENKS